MEVTIQAPDMGSASGSRHMSRRLADVVDSMGLALAPRFPAAVEPDLCRFFVVSVPDLQAAQRVIDAVIGRRLAEQAYVKPHPHPA
jgi:hypothetical protein